MTRTEQITALLRSLYDYLEYHPGGVKTSRMNDLPGPAPTAWAPCQPCQGKGHFGKAKRPCAACGAKGNVLVDKYTGEPVATKDSGQIHAADARRIDAELAKLARDEEIRRGRMLDDPFRWEASRIRYRQAGSYASVERALDSLRANEPDLCSLVMRTLVYGVSPVTETARPHLDAAIDFIAHRMPAEVRVPRWVTEGPPAVEREWKAGERGKTQPRMERNAKIIAMRAEGLSQAAIAREVGVSQRTVSSVLSSVRLAGTAA